MQNEKEAGTAAPASPQIGQTVDKKTLAKQLHELTEKINRVCPGGIRDRSGWVLSTEEKIPCNAETGKPTDVTDYANGVKLKRALEVLLRDRGQRYRGVGVMLGHPHREGNKSFNLAGIDLDNAYNENGELHPWAKRIVAMFPGAYIERSRSGQGVHILFLCQKRFHHGLKKSWTDETGKHSIEIYTHDRYFIFTGDVIQECAHLPDMTEVAEQFREKYILEGRPSQSCALAEADELFGKSRLTDKEVVELLRNGPSGEKFKKLYDDGDKSDYAGDDSRADLGLCGLLAPATNRDPDQMDSIFRDSALIRDKWDEARGEYLYGERTIRTAVLSCSRVHNAQIDAAEMFEAVDPGEDTPGIPGGGKDTVRPTPKGVNAAELMVMEIAPIIWLIEFLIGPGLVILAGAPKIGKSWMVLQLGIAVAKGMSFLGFATRAAEVAYLALEDSYGRIQERLRIMLDGEEAPAGLHIYTEWARLDQGGMEDLDRLLTDNQQIKLVIIDIWQRIRPARKNGLNAHEADYQELPKLKAVADRHNAAIICIHHTRKSASGSRDGGGDPFEGISGSMGILGAADTGLLLSRHRGVADAVLRAVGRDIEGGDFAIVQDKRTCCWEFIGPAARLASTPERQRIVDAVNKLGESRPKEIAEATGLREEYVRQTVTGLVHAGLMAKVKFGVYAPVFTEVQAEEDFDDL